jgi:hypothetical protein
MNREIRLHELADNGYNNNFKKISENKFVFCEYYGALEISIVNDEIKYKYDDDEENECKKIKIIKMDDDLIIFMGGAMGFDIQFHIIRNFKYENKKCELEIPNHFNIKNILCVMDNKIICNTLASVTGYYYIVERNINFNYVDVSKCTFGTHNDFHFKIQNIRKSKRSYIYTDNIDPILIHDIVCGGYFEGDLYLIINCEYGNEICLDTYGKMYQKNEWISKFENLRCEFKYDGNNPFSILIIKSFKMINKNNIKYFNELNKIMIIMLLVRKYNIINKHKIILPVPILFEILNYMKT